MAALIKNNNKRPARRKQPAIANKFKKQAVDTKTIEEQEETEVKNEDIQKIREHNNIENMMLTNPLIAEQQVSQKSIPTYYDNQYKSDRITQIKRETKNRSKFL